MPSPLGHALGGVAIGLAASGAARPIGHDRLRLTALFACLGMAPDLDLLVGMHSGPTHGLGAALIAGVIAYLSSRGRPHERVRFSSACALAYASHTLLDALGTDTLSPIGIMAFWPVSQGYYQTGLHVFMAVSRRIHQPHLFWAQNLTAIAREIVILLPPALVALWWAGRPARGGRMAGDARRARSRRSA